MYILKKLFFFSEPLKLALIVEAENWKFALGRSMNAKYKEKLDSMVSFIADYSRRLIHPIEDLDDVRFAMAALNDIRHNEIKLDTDMGPIEVMALRYSGFANALILTFNRRLCQRWRRELFYQDPLQN